MVDLPGFKTFGAASMSDSHLAEVTGVSSNPGQLRGRLYLPPSLQRGAPLVVALHGCTQTAAGYDRGTGWSTLAEREGFALLLPEQARGNNPNGCFNWFTPGDIARCGGEAESIAAMVEAVVAEHSLDRARVFVTGLSAGGAMTAVMLATYPELFAGGAIIGGLPYGRASGVPEALAAMRAPSGNATELAQAVRSASAGYRGSWPSVSVWHGAADHTVAVANMDATTAQWLGVHGLDPAACSTEHGAGWTHRTWRGADGRIAVEERRIAGMGHGVPIDPSGSDRLGVAGPFMLDVALSSTAEIARSWGLVAAAEVRREPAEAPVRRRLVPEVMPANDTAAPPASAATSGVGQVIEDALRAAGLMR
ncbi:alpha/beta hydrolase family esterase [uncultured Sphingomonas sp.]|uniref:extracellular catalytic domain type 1 short-chain-length polyhydroxyalkanoate depolymerase n=1 Tax=uncultured Sphingomonas sp. TaxID=158754 RepID=UPI0035CBDCBD